jgi:hypothetical protein
MLKVIINHNSTRIKPEIKFSKNTGADSQEEKAASEFNDVALIFHVHLLSHFN